MKPFSMSKKRYDLMREKFEARYPYGADDRKKPEYKKKFKQFIDAVLRMEKQAGMKIS